MTNIEIRKEHEGDCFDFIPSSSSDEASVQLKPRKKMKKKRFHPRQTPAPPPPPLNDDMFEMLTNPSKKIDSEEERESEVSFEPKVNFAEEFEEDNNNFEEKGVEEEKQELLYKLYRCQAKGVPVNKKFNAYSDINDLRNEVKRITRDLDVNASLRFSRRALMAVVTGLEFLNKKVDPFDMKLEGWSDSVMENINDYDNVFEKLHDKYASAVSVAPEIELLLLLGGSAFMFHISNSMMNTLPTMNQAMKQNPDMIKNMLSTLSKATGETPKKEEPQQETKTNQPREMKPPTIDLSHMMPNIPTVSKSLVTVSNQPFPDFPMNTSAMSITSNMSDDDASATSVEKKQISFSESTVSRSRRRKNPLNGVSNDKVISI